MRTKSIYNFFSCAMVFPLSIFIIVITNIFFLFFSFWLSSASSSFSPTSSSLFYSTSLISFVAGVTVLFLSSSSVSSSHRFSRHVFFGIVISFISLVPTTPTSLCSSSSFSSLQIFISLWYFPLLVCKSFFYFVFSSVFIFFSSSTSFSSPIFVLIPIHPLYIITGNT